MDTADGVPLSNTLIVDDTPANLHVLTAMLKTAGYRPRPTPSGALALRAAEIELPDLGSHGGKAQKLLRPGAHVLQARRGGAARPHRRGEHRGKGQLLLVRAAPQLTCLSRPAAAQRRPRPRRPQQPSTAAPSRTQAGQRRPERCTRPGSIVPTRSRPAGRRLPRADPPRPR